MCHEVGFIPTVWADGGYSWYKVLYTADSFVYMAMYDLGIEPCLSFSVPFFLNAYYIFLVKFYITSNIIFF